jgi:hypothetical protein
MQRSPDDVDGMTYAQHADRKRSTDIHTQETPETLTSDDVRNTAPPHTTNEETHHPTSHAKYQRSVDDMPYGSDDDIRQRSVDDMRQRSVDIMRRRHRLYLAEASTLCGGEALTMR